MLLILPILCIGNLVLIWTPCSIFISWKTKLPHIWSLRVSRKSQYDVFIPVISVNSALLSTSMTQRNTFNKDTWVLKSLYFLILDLSNIRILVDRNCDSYYFMEPIKCMGCEAMKTLVSIKQTVMSLNISLCVVFHIQTILVYWLKHIIIKMRSIATCSLSLWFQGLYFTPQHHRRHHDKGEWNINSHTTEDVMKLSKSISPSFERHLSGFSSLPPAHRFLF